MISIEKVTEKDTEALLAIYNWYVRETAVSFEYETPSAEEFAERIRNISADYPYLKAVEDGRILGYAYAHSFIARKAYDWSVEVTIYLDKDCRKRGVGPILYSALERSLMDMGVLNMNACIAVPDGKDEHLTMDSPKFHEKMGFRMVGTFTDSGYKFDTWYDMIWMEKIIGVHGHDQPAVRKGDWKIISQEDNI